ncbi:MAG: cytochrome c maturation protein CcmE domain-containing protein [Thermoplasmatota archaeon]
MKRSAKLALVLLFVVAGGLIAFAGASPAGYHSVADVASHPTTYANGPISMKASVAPGSLRENATPITFVVAEGSDALTVEWATNKALPMHEAGGTIEGRNVVLHGSLVARNGGWVFLADDMQVGCASKYEPNRS